MLSVVGNLQPANSSNNTHGHIYYGSWSCIPSYKFNLKGIFEHCITVINIFLLQM